MRLILSTTLRLLVGAFLVALLAFPANAANTRRLRNRLDALEPATRDTLSKEQR